MNAMFTYVTCPVDGCDYRAVQVVIDEHAKLPHQTCPICGRKFGTNAQYGAHTGWHVRRKKG